MPEEPVLEYTDLENLDGVRQHVYVDFEQLPGEPRFWEEWERPDMPEDIREMAEEILGDGGATITVGMDVKTSRDFGNAAGCMVYVKLTCNQDEDTIGTAHSIASNLALRYVEEGQKRAQHVLDQATGLVRREPDDEEVVTKAAPAKAKKKPTGASAGPRKKSKAPAPKTKPGAKRVGKTAPTSKKRGAKKPSYRRT
jgi:hypothetical protein